MAIKVFFTFISFFFTQFLFTQINYIEKGNQALELGQFDEAVLFYKKAFIDNPKQEIETRLNHVIELRNNYKDYENAIQREDFIAAELYLINLEKLEPNNLFIKNKREALNFLRNKKGKEASKDAISRFVSCFWGNNKRHRLHGGLRLYGGYAFSKSNHFSSESEINDGMNIGIFYNNSRKLTISFGVEYNSLLESESFNFYGGYKIFPFNSNNFSINLGYGYKRFNNVDEPQPYNQSAFFYKTGFTLIFSEYYGGVEYDFQKSTGKNTGKPVHNITYIFAPKTSKALIGLGAFIGLLGLLGSVGN